MNIKEIALNVAKQMRESVYPNPYISESAAIDFAEALVAELAKGNEPVARLLHRKTRSLQDSGRTVARTYEECALNAYPEDWEEGTALYALPPTASQIEQETAEAWQPIETAPKDGVLILCKSFRRLTTEQSREISWNGKCWVTRDGSRISEPSHWMPLPKAPANTASS